MRRKLQDRKLRWATFLFALAITFLALIPGFLFVPLGMVLVFASALLVANLMIRGHGQFSMALLQASMTGAVFTLFHAIQPLLPFVILGNVILPILLRHWVDMIHDMNR